jgi:hypothetical protein
MDTLNLTMETVTAAFKKTKQFIVLGDVPEE